eukprot:3820263-Lingulodinium_polyedra.AAC.1
MERATVQFTGLQWRNVDAGASLRSVSRMLRNDAFKSTFRPWARVERAGVRFASRRSAETSTRA